MKTLYIHAGMPKCGTSALQVFLAQNSDKLRDSDLDYLQLGDLSGAKSGEITSGNAGPLARSMYPPKHPGRIDGNNSFLEELLSAVYAKKTRQKTLPHRGLRHFIYIYLIRQMMY